MLLNGAFPHIIHQKRVRDTMFFTYFAYFGGSEAFAEWLSNGTGDKIFLLRDDPWQKMFPVILGVDQLQKLKVNTADETLFIEVQPVETESMKKAVTSMCADVIVEKFVNQLVYSHLINILNLKALNDGTIP